MTAPGYYDESLTPEILALAQPKATGATAGTPGTWTPADHRAPSGVAEATSWGVVASPATAWTSGQYIQTTTAGAAGRITWSGSTWVGGAAPLAVSGMTVAEVEQFVTDNPDRLQEVYDLESAGKARATLLAWLRSAEATDESEPAP